MIFPARAPHADPLLFAPLPPPTPPLSLHTPLFWYPSSLSLCPAHVPTTIYALLCRQVFFVTRTSSSHRAPSPFLRSHSIRPLAVLPKESCPYIELSPTFLFPLTCFSTIFFHSFPPVLSVFLSPPSPPYEAYVKFLQLSFFSS